MPTSGTQTLLDVFKERKDPLEAGVIETFLDHCHISRVLPITTTGTSEVANRRKNGVVAVGWREGRGQRFGTLQRTSKDKVADAVFQMGGEISLDKFDYRDKSVNGPALLSDTIQDAVEGMAWEFTNTFINGDHGTNPHSFEGVKVRLGISGASRTIYAIDASNDLDVRPATATNAELYTWLDRIEDAVDAVDGNRADVALCNSGFIKGLKSTLRRLGLYTSEDISKPSTLIKQRSTDAIEFHDPAFTWNGIKFIDMGYKADQTNKVIATDSIGGNACEPVYFLRLGKPYLRGIQMYPIEIDKPHLGDDRVTYTMVVDWPVGLNHVHPRFGSVLRGVYTG